MITKDKKECCGCTACQNICPVRCIEMVEDIEGFLYPEIDEEKCIHCHKCEIVCPIRNKENISGVTETYIGYIKNEEIRRRSSSGGIFTALAEWMLEQGGVVIGAAFDESFQVHHIVVEIKEELEKLRGSKYVQSNLKSIYPTVKQYLQDGRKVMFSGTACQIAGLKKYLKNENVEQLYTVDVLCHGVPSPKVWRMYLADKVKTYSSQIVRINLRDKKNGWNNYSVCIQFDNRKEYCNPFFQDQYTKMFLDNLDLRPSCYDCKFKCFPRMSDITIGDCWGIESIKPEMDDNNGTSVIIINSYKGKMLFDNLKNYLFFAESDIDLVLPKHSESRYPVSEHQNRKNYIQALYEEKSFEELFKLCQLNFHQKVKKYLNFKIQQIMRR